MTSLSQALTGHFTVVSLGCIGDADYPLPENIVRSLTAVEVDAEGGAVTQSQYHRKVVINRPIGAVAGKHTFIRNSFAGTCSLLRPDAGLVEAYGMERYCDMAGSLDVECETLPQALKREEVSGLDFLKTDVEGLDAAIIRSCEEYLGSTLCIQCELRFQPFYEGEPPFHEVVAYLAGFGYEVLDIIHIDRWKYRTEHQRTHLNGRAVWGDFVFALRPDRLALFPAVDRPLAVAKQVIICTMLGKKNYGEFLLERFRDCLPLDWRRDLARLVKPGFPTVLQARRWLRQSFMPVEILLRHILGRSTHVSVRLGK